jgi:Mg-chelatase subunit ChlI
MLKTAVAHAAFEGRLAINERDILLAAELALPHRLKKRSLQESELQFERLEKRLEMAGADVLLEAVPSDPADSTQPDPTEKKRPRATVA